VIVGHLEQCCLGLSVLAELIQFMHAAGFGPVLFSLAPALGLVPLFLLACLFSLTLGKS